MMLFRPTLPRPPRGVTAAIVTLALALSGAAATLASEPTTFSDLSPFGHIGSMSVVPGGVRVIGWDLDPSNQKRSLRTYATVDHLNPVVVTANHKRAHVAKRYKKAGALHGFNFVVPAPEGRHVVCVGAYNIGHGARHTLGCETFTLDYGPFGAIDRVTNKPGALDIRGWAIDRDAPTAPVSMTITLDGAAHTVTANRSRSDIARAHPGTGTAHGFDIVLPTSQGAHRVCATATNIGYGSNNSFGCRTATLNNNPMLGINYVHRNGTHDTLRVRGWAIDGDAPTSPVKITETIDGRAASFYADQTRDDVAKAYPGTGSTHGFARSVVATEGRHTVCLVAANVGFGSNTTPPCRTVTISYTPAAALSAVTATATGLQATGWSVDPDTATPTKVQITVDGKLATTTTANRAGAALHRGHHFTASVASVSGRHTVCAIGINEVYGTHNSAPQCAATTLALRPLGAFQTASRVAGSNSIALSGWAFDPDTSAPLTIAATLDGAALPNMTANAARSDVARSYPSAGADHGFATTLATTDGEHRICLTALNVGGGSNTSLGCKIVNAVHPVAASAPVKPHGTGAYGAVTVSWTPSASDGGAPISAYVVRASNGSTATAAATATSATVTGLKSHTPYSFTVEAVNVVGSSARSSAGTVWTLSGPPPQTTPAPVSTSRYIRNIRGSSSSDLAQMRAEGLADAQRDVSGHSYLVLLDIGGQDQTDGGVVLSASTRFISYSSLVRDLEAYTDGYHAGQHGTAPAMIALGTNNDMDVSRSSGAAWATSVVNVVRSHIRSYAGMYIAGANDIEPGFRASYTASRNWLSGYLASTSATFVFNGSADGCAWTTTGRRCNNGWTMAGLYGLATGAAPTRTYDVPQVYNTTMAAQWKYISLTGVASKQPRIRFGGTLTEFTACRQAGSCGSLSGKTAWSTLWQNLQSDSRLKISSLPWATDLRIDQ